MSDTDNFFPKVAEALEAYLSGRQVTPLRSTPKIMFQNHLKPLNKNAVRTAALRLMERNYTTTMREVRQLLRAQNYWAVQCTVNRWLEELAEEEDWYFVSDRYERNYFRNEVTANYYETMSQEEMDYFLSYIKFSVN